MDHVELLQVSSDLNLEVPTWNKTDFQTYFFSFKIYYWNILIVQMLKKWYFVIDLRFISINRLE